MKVFRFSITLGHQRLFDINYWILQVKSLRLMNTTSKGDKSRSLIHYIWSVKNICMERDFETLISQILISEYEALKESLEEEVDAKSDS